MLYKKQNKKKWIRTDDDFEIYSAKIGLDIEKIYLMSQF